MVAKKFISAPMKRHPIQRGIIGPQYMDLKLSILEART
jgi:hypothetical protein